MYLSILLEFQMKFESVKALKTEVQHNGLLTVHSSDPNMTLAKPAEREGHIPDMAFGIICPEDPNDYKLALRLESAGDLETREIARILALPHGTVDIKISSPIDLLSHSPDTP
jgi:predicted RNA polymerase sigma factor